MDDLASFFQEQSAAIPNVRHLPSYKVLQMAIMAGVEQGVWKMGELLPPERKLAAACGMSVGTVKRAMLELVHQGLLFRRQGSGTYVAGVSFQRQHRRYYLLLKDFYEKESENAVSLVSLQRIPPVPYINESLYLPADEDLFEVVRLFSEDGRKCVLAHSYLGVTRFPDMDKIARNRLEHVPLFIVLDEEYHMPTLRNHELFGVTCAGSKESTLLDIAEGTPLLLIKALVYSYNEKPFEYRISHCLTDNKLISRSM